MRLGSQSERKKQNFLKRGDNSGASHVEIISLMDLNFVIWSMTRPGGSWSNRQPLASGGLKSDKKDETIMEMMKMKVFRMGWG